MASNRRLFTIGDVSGNVTLNYWGHPVNQFARLADSYRGAATVLAKNFEAEARSDFDAYPLVFMYRHALELYLKAILVLGNKLAVSTENEELHTEDVFKNHALTAHLVVVKRIFAEAGWEEDYPHMGLEEPFFEDVLKEFDELDKGSYTFRYTVNKDGTANIEKNFAFSIPNFVAIMDRVLHNLSGACYGLEEMSDQAAEMYHEVRAEYEADMRADYEADMQAEMEDYMSDFSDYGY
jgi:hypothetical protein